MIEVLRYAPITILEEGVSTDRTGAGAAFASVADSAVVPGVDEANPPKISLTVGWGAVFFGTVNLKSPFDSEDDMVAKEVAVGEN
jgi:hypothetical protein